MGVPEPPGEGDNLGVELPVKSCSCLFMIYQVATSISDSAYYQTTVVLFDSYTDLCSGIDSVAGAALVEVVVVFIMLLCVTVDDGKIFVGCGVGEPFGPECNKGRSAVSFQLSLLVLCNAQL